MASPSLGGMVDVAQHMCKKWDLAFDLYLDEPLSDDDNDDIVEISNPNPQVEDIEVNMDTDEAYYNVYKILKHKYQQGWKFLVWWENFPPSASTWEPISAFSLPNGAINSIFKQYCLENGLTNILQKVLSS